MKTNSKLSAYILRGSTAALVFSYVIVALCSAIHLPEQPHKAPPPQDNAASGVNILGYDNINQSAQGHDFTIANNLFIDVSSANWGGYGRLFQVLNNARNVTFSHNTGFADGSVLFADLEPSTGFVYQNNLATNGQYGVLGTDYASGTSTLAHYFPGYIFSANAFIGAPNSGSYPSGNFFPAGIANVGFVNYSNGNYALSSGSPYYTAGSNGTSIGVDTTALNSALTAVSAVSTTSSSTTTGSSSSGTTTGSSSGTTTGSSGSSSTGTTTRIEQNASGVTYSGAWTSNNYSGQSRGSAVLAADAGSRASLTFTGTGVNWIGFRDAWSGLANVYLNGVLKDTVDTYAATDGYQVPLWSISGLPYGPYTLDVEVAGKKNAASNGFWVWVDAFDYLP